MRSSVPNLCLDTIDSTSNYLKEHPEFWQENFFSIRALRQTQGRGRYGRSWFSGENNLTFSFVFNPPEFVSSSNLSPLTIVAGLALREAAENLTKKNIQIKWPNDIVFSGKKLAGILSEMTQTANQKIIIFGIGLNLNSDNMPSDISEKSISLKDIDGLSRSPDNVLNEIMIQMKAYLTAFKIPLSDSIRSEFSRHCLREGNLVSIMDYKNNKIVKKNLQVMGINEQGLLGVSSMNGDIEFIDAYEVEINS